MNKNDQDVDARFGQKSRIRASINFNPFLFVCVCVCVDTSSSSSSPNNILHPHSTLSFYYFLLLLLEGMDRHIRGKKSYCGRSGSVSSSRFPENKEDMMTIGCTHLKQSNKYTFGFCVKLINDVVSPKVS